jgi:hypothetical protein
MTKDKLIGTAYVNIIKDEKGQVKFAYGYELNEKEISLNDLGMLNSFLGKLKEQAQQDFNERLDMNDKEFSIEKDGVEEEDV